jgi:hypothetical protein
LPSSFDRSASEKPPSGPTNKTMRCVGPFGAGVASLRSSSTRQRSAVVHAGEVRNVSKEVGGCR